MATVVFTVAFLPSVQMSTHWKRHPMLSVTKETFGSHPSLTGPWTTVREHWTMTWVNNNLLLIKLKQSSCIIKGGCDGTITCFTPSISISKDCRGPGWGCLGPLSAPLDVRPGNPLPTNGPIKREGDAHIKVPGARRCLVTAWALSRSFCCLSKIRPQMTLYWLGCPPDSQEGEHFPRCTSELLTSIDAWTCE